MSGAEVSVRSAGDQLLGVSDPEVRSVFARSTPSRGPAWVSAPGLVSDTASERATSATGPAGHPLQPGAELMPLPEAAAEPRMRTQDHSAPPPHRPPSVYPQTWVRPDVVSAREPAPALEGVVGTHSFVWPAEQPANPATDLAMPAPRAITGAAPTPAATDIPDTRLWLPSGADTSYDAPPPTARFATDYRSWTTDAISTRGPGLRVVPPEPLAIAGSSALALSPSLPQSPPPTEVDDEPATTEPPRPGWWRRARSAPRVASESVLEGARQEVQDKATPELLRCLSRPLPPDCAPYVVSTVSLKGGVGKTTVSSCLGLALAHYRADRVLAADLNLHAGTLADRLIPGAPRASVQHLLDDLLDDATPVSAVGDIDRYVDVAGRLSVLAGHKDPSIGAAFAEGDVSELMACLGRFFHILLADCGTGIADEAMQAVLRETDTLVLVATPTPDVAVLAEETLNWLDNHGYGRLVNNSVAVVNGPAGRDRAGACTRLRDRCREVVTVPADPHLATGQVITLEALAEETHHAYVALAAAVMDAAATSESR